MSQSKKDLVLAAFNNKPVDRVPVGFWFHFTDPEEHMNGLTDPTLVRRNIEGHKRFYEAFHPDFVKVMSDGFLGYPNEVLKTVKSVEELKGVKSLGEGHPWITKQVEIVKKVSDMFGKKVMLFYNVFAPVRYLILQQGVKGYHLAAKLIAEDKEVFKSFLSIIAQDISNLTKRVITEGKADGIYFCVQCIQDASVTKEVYDDAIAPSDLAVLDVANKLSENNILHVCGYEGSRNDLTWFKDYPAKAVNWAVNVEGVSLADGKKIFGDRAVIGGFDNTVNGYLYRGTKEEIEAYTEGLIKGAGKRGVILGADCTVPNDIDVSRLEWVRKKAASL